MSWTKAAALSAVLLAGCTPSPPSADTPAGQNGALPAERHTPLDKANLALAEAVLRRQLASDISWSLDDRWTAVYPHGNRITVCSIANLHRPGDGPLALNNVRQRVVIKVIRPSGAGMATFDGRSDMPGQVEFQALWDKSCR